MKTTFIECCEHGGRYVAGCYIPGCAGARERIFEKTTIHEVWVAWRDLVRQGPTDNTVWVEVQK